VAEIYSSQRGNAMGRITLVPRDAAELMKNLSRWRIAHVWRKIIHLLSSPSIFRPSSSRAQYRGDDLKLLDPGNGNHLEFLPICTNC
jgi:hypothetical protein